MALSRRELLLTTAGVAGGCACGVFAHNWLSAQSRPVAAGGVIPDAPPARDALQKLIDGNRRFVDGRPAFPNRSAERRVALRHEQHPFAVILGCSDSRVPPEVVFDQGLGDLFVIREAGNVADDDTLGTVEYAVEHLHSPLVVVLGHQGCGAVTAAVGAVVRDEAVEGHVLHLVDDIAPAVMEVQGRAGDLVDESIRANVRHVVRRLRASGPVLRSRDRRGEVRIVGCYYSLATGVVEWLPT